MYVSITFFASKYFLKLIHLILKNEMHLYTVGINYIILQIKKFKYDINYFNRPWV